MAVTIKLKNASGSDPSASDLVLGELAVRTDNGKIFLKKDDGSVAEVSGGGIDDGDKGDITVSNSGATFTIDNDAVTYAKIQNVSATDRLLGRDSSGAGVIEEISPSSVRTMLGLATSATTDTTNADNIGSGTLAAARVATLNQDTTGNAASADTVDIAGNGTDNSYSVIFSTNGAAAGRSLAIDSSSSQFVYNPSSNVLTVGSVTGNLTGLASTASALHIARTIAGTSFDGSANIDISYNNLTNKPTIPTNNNQLTNGAGYITAMRTQEEIEDFVGNMVTGNTETGITVTYQDSDGTLDFVVASQTDNNFTTTLKNKLDGIESGATADQSASEILTLLKTVDGAGSGLDADTLDGISSASFLRSDASDTMSGQLTLSENGSYPLNINGSSDAKILLQGSSNPYIRWREGSTDKAYIQWSTSGYLQLANEEAGEILRLKDGANGLVWSVGGTEHVVYHANNLTVGDGGLTQKNFTTTLKNKLDGIAASATNVTNNNQLTNGAGYTTYSANQSLDTSSSPTFNDIYANNWIRNNAANEGMYNQSTGMHWYSANAGYMDIGGGQSGQGIRCRDNHNGTLRGYFYYDNSNRIGILDGDGNWAVRVDKDVSVDFRVNSTVELTVLPDTVRCEGAFFENAQAVAANKTISDGYNAMSAGPITVNNSVTVTVGSGEVWTII